MKDFRNEKDALVVGQWSPDLDEARD